MNTIDKLLVQFEKELHKTKNLTDLDQLGISYLGRNGTINGLLKNIKTIPDEARKEYGKKVNEIKGLIKRFIMVKRSELARGAEGRSYVDVTVPGKTYPKGSLHLVSYAIEEIGTIFQKIGFIRMSYPEVEWEYFSFLQL